jgi:Ca2+-transporting ATPase
MDYHSLSTDATLAELRTSERGLSDIEIDERQREYGINTLAVHTEPLWKKIIEPFRSIFIIVLFFAAMISLFHHAYIDAIIILVIIAVSAIIYYVQQYSTEKILRSLQKHNKLEVTVVRSNGTVVIDSIELVPGDIILLEEGDKVPADSRLIDVRSFRVDESQLTGESLPVQKHSDPVAQASEIYERHNMVYQGSFTIGGYAKAVVVATGNTTEFGRLAALSSETDSTSPVQLKIDKLITQIIVAVVAIAMTSFVLAVYRGIELTEALRFVIALAVSAVPESLPIAISVILALGMHRMAKRKALVRSMPAIETIGVITTIATDKTGTLTKNKLTVQELWATSTNAVLESSLVNSLLPQGSSKVGDPLDTAFTEYATKRHITHSKKTMPAKVFQFEHSVAMSGNLWHKGNHFELFIKGAPEHVIERSDLTENERESVTAKLHHLTGLGYRVIALAHTEITTELSSLEALPKRHKLTFDGFVAIADILRPEAKAAIKTAQKAGIIVRMITGDHFETAYHIGKELGLVASRDEVFDSRKLSVMSDEELANTIDTIRVFARVVPEQKHRILSVLKKRDITAMTGDGVNDVPALTNAHVGLAMGSGVQIAKDAGDIILLDDNFRSIVSAVHEGRTIYANIKRMVTYLLSTNLGEVLVSFGSLVFGMPLPLAPVQILWINLATDSCLVIPLGLEPGEKRNMNVPPHKASAPLLSKYMVSRIVITALTMAITVLVLYWTYMNTYGVDYARTVAFSVLVVMQWASALSMRSDYEPVWKRVFKLSPAFLIGLTTAIILHLAALFTPLGELLHITTISLGDLAHITGIGIVVPLIVIETHKLVGRMFFKKGTPIK